MEKIIHLVTTNPKKIKEFESLVANRLIIKPLHLPLKEYEVNQEKILLAKAEQAYQKIIRPVVVDDTGFYISKFHNFPGPLANHILKSLGLQGLMALYDVGDEAFFKCLICYKDTNVTEIFEGILYGNLIKPSNTLDEHWPYSSLFIPRNESETLNDLLNNVGPVNFKTHRAIAMNKLINYLEDQN